MFDNFENVIRNSSPLSASVGLVTKRGSITNLHNTEA